MTGGEGGLDREPVTMRRFSSVYIMNKTHRQKMRRQVRQKDNNIKKMQNQDKERKRVRVRERERKRERERVREREEL